MEDVVAGLFSDVNFYIVGEIDEKVKTFQLGMLCVNINKSNIAFLSGLDLLSWLIKLMIKLILKKKSTSL